jgi:uncharacterized membrane protein
MAETENPDSSQTPGNNTDSEKVWTYRGYSLRASEFTTAMVHFFRAEIQRANVWRQRLDTTTNWAVVTTGAAISIAFAREGNHAVMLINILLVLIFLIIESRRYRYYELWSYRVRLIETDFYAPMLVPPFHPSEDWAEALAESLLHPDFPISALEAIGRRLRRNYMFIFSIIFAAWLIKLWLLPTPANTWREAISHAAIGTLAGEWVMAVVITFIVAALIVSFATIGLQQASGEVLPRYTGFSEATTTIKPAAEKAWNRTARRRKQLLTLIITDQSDDVGQIIIKEMGRGVTALAGKGMYTGESHQVLLCALTVTEIPQLKELVHRTDPKAFVVVSPAQEILGKGFLPFEKNN